MKFETLRSKLSNSRLTIKRNGLIVFFLLIVVEILLNFLGHQYYGMIVIPFFFLLIWSHPRNFPLLIASILLIVLLNTPVVHSWEKVNAATSEVYHDPAYWLEHIFTPRAGENVLSNEVRDMLTLARSHSIPDYRLEGDYQADNLTFQRVIEGMWPLRMAATSTYFFSSKYQIINYPACSEIDREGEVILAYCP